MEFNTEKFAFRFALIVVGFLLITQLFHSEIQTFITQSGGCSPRYGLIVPAVMGIIALYFVSRKINSKKYKNLFLIDLSALFILSVLAIILSCNPTFNRKIFFLFTILILFNLIMIYIFRKPVEKDKNKFKEYLEKFKEVTSKETHKRKDKDEMISILGREYKTTVLQTSEVIPESKENVVELLNTVIDTKPIAEFIPKKIENSDKKKILKDLHNSAENQKDIFNFISNEDDEELESDQNSNVWERNGDEEGATVTVYDLETTTKNMVKKNKKSVKAYNRRKNR